MTNATHLTRQLDIVPMEILSTPITIVGAGAIGGWCTLALAKMGFANITVYDFDQVDEVNLNSQFYRTSDVGKYKVDALKSLVQDFTGVEITALNRRYRDDVFDSGILIAAVDSMEVRRSMWEAHVNEPTMLRAIIDPRMGAETALLFVMQPQNPHDQKAYVNSLYTDANAVHERCTAKATIYTANLLSGLVVKAVKDILTRPDYLRTAQWNIAENEFFGWKATVE